MSNLSKSLQKSREEAQRILQRANRKEGQATDVHAIAEMLGLDVKELSIPDSSVSGFLRNEDDAPEIVVNKDHSEERQRFTIAHEIGHFVLHASSPLYLDDVHTAQPAFFRDAESSRATKISEIEANQFAAELLMPNGEIAEQARSLSNAGAALEDELVGRLAKQYKVSFTAMAIRLGTF